MADSPIQPGNFNEELLSGYLDGELSSEEQAQVEHAVQQDPQAQQLLEDLEQIRHCLQELPAKQPPADARQRVLEKINSEDLAGNGGPPLSAVKRTLPTTAIVSWLVATAAGIALLFIVPPLLQDSNQVALNRGDATSSHGPEEIDESLAPFADLAGGEGMEEKLALPAMLEMESEEYFSEQIPVVYITIPADAVEYIDEILVMNRIRVIEPSVLIERLRANKQNEGSSGLAILASKVLSDEDAAPDAAPGGDLAPADHSLADRSAVTRPLDSRRQQGGRYVQYSTTLREGSPEELEIAWEQISQVKDIKVVQQAGPQLRGLKYDANAYRDQSLATDLPSEKDLGKTFAENAPQAAGLGGGAGKASAGAGSQKLAQQPESQSAKGVDKKRVSADPAVTRKSGENSNPIIIRLIIQVAE
jgi:sporulation protein YlmC with PRC-barrel domain